MQRRRYEQIGRERDPILEYARRAVSVGRCCRLFFLNAKNRKHVFGCGARFVRDYTGRRAEEGGEIDAFSGKRRQRAGAGSLHEQRRSDNTVQPGLTSKNPHTHIVV